GGGHRLSAPLLAVQPHPGRLPGGVHQVPLPPLHLEQPRGRARLHCPRPPGRPPRRLFHRPLAAAVARPRHPRRPDHPRHLLPDPLVHLLPHAPDGGHLRRPHPHPPDRRAPHHHLGHDRLLRGRARRPRGRRAHRRLLVPRRLLADRPPPGQARGDGHL